MEQEHCKKCGSPHRLGFKNPDGTYGEMCDVCGETFWQEVEVKPQEQFTTGSVRDTREGKGRYDLICPHFQRRLAVHCETGAKKYGDRNWEKGQPQSRIMDSCLRHLNSYMAGMDDEDHLAAAAWNIMAMISQEERIHDLPRELMDLHNGG